MTRDHLRYAHDNGDGTDTADEAGPSLTGCRDCRNGDHYACTAEAGDCTTVCHPGDPCEPLEDMCRDCGAAHRWPWDCPKDRHERLDRWVEAILGGRLRFHVGDRDANPMPEAAYWSGVYRRWQELYRLGEHRATAAVWDQPGGMS
jgi:hypothetical protein